MLRIRSPFRLSHAWKHFPVVLFVVAVYVYVCVCAGWALVFNVNAVPRNDWQKINAKQAMRREILVQELDALNLMLFDMVICSEIQRFYGDSQFLGGVFSPLLFCSQHK